MRTRLLRLGLWTLSAVAAPAAAFAGSVPALGPEIKVNVSTVDLQSNPRVAVFPDGGFVVAWNASPAAPAAAGAHSTIVVHARFFAASGAPASGEILLPVAGTGPTLDGVAPIGNNRFVVAWDDYGQPVSRVMIQLFNRNGRAVSGPLQVHADSPFNRYFGVVATNAAGNIAVLWAADVGNGNPDYRNDAYARFFDKHLAPLTDAVLVREGSFSDGSGPFPDSAAMAADGTLAAALTYAGDGVTVFVSLLAPDGSQLPVSDIYAPDCCTLNTYQSSLAMAADGSFLVTWDSVQPAQPGTNPPPLPAAPISGRLLGADGTALDDGVVTINRRQYGQLVSPAAAALPGGGFVTAWQDEAGRDGSGFGVFGRLLAADGTPQGRDFQIDVTAAGDQVDPVIAGGPGGAVVVWLSGKATTIYARRVSAASTTGLGAIGDIGLPRPL